MYESVGRKHVNEGGNPETILIPLLTFPLGYNTSIEDLIVKLEKEKISVIFR